MAWRNYAVVLCYPNKVHVIEVRAGTAHRALRDVETCEIEEAESISVLPLKDWRATQKDA